MTRFVWILPVAFACEGPPARSPEAPAFDATLVSGEMPPISTLPLPPLRWEVDASRADVFAHDARLLFTAEEAVLVARDLASGREAWRRDLGFVPASLHVFANRVVARSSKETVAAIRLDDGVLDWREEVGCALRGRLAGNAERAAGYCLDVAEDLHAIGIDLATGRVAWRHRIGRGSSWLEDTRYPDLAADGTTVYVPDFVSVREGAALALDLRTGLLRWWCPLEPDRLLVSGSILIGTDRDSAKAVSTADGRELWRVDGGRSPLSIDTGGTIFERELARETHGAIAFHDLAAGALRRTVRLPPPPPSVPMGFATHLGSIAAQLVVLRVGREARHSDHLLEWDGESWRAWRMPAGGALVGDLVVEWRDGHLRAYDVRTRSGSGS